jgi:hypothetical protein
MTDLPLIPSTVVSVSNMNGGAVPSGAWGTLT